MITSKRILFAILIAILVPAPLLAGDMAHADDPDHAGDADDAVNTTVTHYAEIGEVLAQDSVNGIQAHALAMLEIMESHFGMMSGAEMEEMMVAHELMESSLAVLAAEELTIADAREAYKVLSEYFIPAAQMMYQSEEGDPTWAVMNCPMAKADWIQVDGLVSNPYYGSKMLRCGKKVSLLETASTESSESDEGMGHHEDHDGGH